MKKDDTYYLRHMLDYAHKLQSLSTHTPRIKYDVDETIQAAYRYWLQVVGEAATHVSESFQDAHSHIAWRPMIGMRNRIVHDYLGIDDDTVWKTVQERIPELIVQLELLLSTPPAHKDS